MAWDGSDAAAQFIAGTRWQDLPPAVQRMARMAAMDTLGATIPGTRTPVSRITARYAARTWPGDSATILLHGSRASAIGAAFANGYAANGIDIDDCGLFTKGHP
ncbi:MAG: MmgE/PrpD family protein, partial [Anaerolineae bacterium]